MPHLVFNGRSLREAIAAVVWSGVISIDKTSAQLLEEAARMIGTDVAHLISAF